MMNLKQKILTLCALLTLIGSAAYAPWTYIHSKPFGPVETETIHDPLWSPPQSGECHLNTAPLVGTWFVIAIIYFGLFFLLKTKELPTPPE